MTAAISPTAVQTAPLPAAKPMPAQTARLAPAETPKPAQAPPGYDPNEEIEHPFAEFDENYEGLTITRAEAEKLWHDDHSKELFGKDGFGFDDFLDIVNPLQHIPVVSSIYRALTDDTIEPGARIAGGALFGGGLGFAAALVNAVIEDASGRDIGEHALALIGIGDDTATDGTAVAAKSGNAVAEAATAGAKGQDIAAIATAAGGTQKDTATPPGRGPVIPVTSKAGKAFGGIMAVPTSQPSATPSESDAAKALLQARADVPKAGPHGALGPSRASRLSTGAGPKPETLSDPNQPVALTPGLAEKLSRMAQQSAARQKAKKPDTALPVGHRSASAGAVAAGPKPLPPAAAAAIAKSNAGRAQAPGLQNAPGKAGIPNIMMDALGKYEAMVRARNKQSDGVTPS